MLAKFTAPGDRFAAVIEEPVRGICDFEGDGVFLHRLDEGVVAAFFDGGIAAVRVDAERGHGLTIAAGILSVGLDGA